MERQTAEMQKGEILSVLRMMYEQSQQRRQHHETMRHQITVLFTSIYAVLGTLIASEYKEININYVCIVFLICAIFGLLFTLSYTERANLYYNRGCVIREIIDKELKTSTLRNCLVAAEEYKSSTEKYRLCKLPSALRHHIIWILFHGVVVLFAIWGLIKNLNI